MPNAILATAAAVLFLFALLTLRRALITRRLVRTLAQLAPTPIAELQPGLRQARGRVQAAQAIPSAFHRRPCVYYAYRVEEPTLGPAPKRLAVGKDWGEALLVDDTGSARIEHRPAMIRAPREHVTELRDVQTVPPEHAEFFEKAGIADKHLGRFKVLRIVEYTLEEGDDVHVTGWVDDDENGKVFYRARRSPLVVSGEADTRLIPGLRNELLLFGLATVLLTCFSLLFFGASLA